MKNFYRKAADRKGFTLVELIVVIAILGILAGIAIPVYSGYIKKANEASLYQELDAVKTAAVFAYTEDHVNDETIAEVTKIEVTATSVKVNGDNDYSKDKDFLTLVGQTDSFSMDFSKVSPKTATWNKEASGSGETAVSAGWTLG